MIASNLKQLINQPEKLNSETLYELRLLLARFPYSQVLRLLFLKNLFLLKDKSFGTELRKAALYVTDRSILFKLLERYKYQIKPKTEDGEESETIQDVSLDRTLTLIDAFLSTLPEETESAPQLDYATDYMSYLMEKDDIEVAEDDDQKCKSFDLIDSFIARSDSDKPIILSLPAPGNTEANSSADAPAYHPPVIDDIDEDEYFTETLAKIYIKQQRYSKALEIIKKLSLKYPKKSAYFADQIEILEQLIINAKSK